MKRHTITIGVKLPVPARIPQSSDYSIRYAKELQSEEHGTLNMNVSVNLIHDPNPQHSNLHGKYEHASRVVCVADIFSENATIGIRNAWRRPRCEAPWVCNFRSLPSDLIKHYAVDALQSLGTVLRDINAHKEYSNAFINKELRGQLVTQCTLEAFERSDGESEWRQTSNLEFDCQEWGFYILGDDIIEPGQEWGVIRNGRHGWQEGASAWLSCLNTKKGMHWEFWKVAFESFLKHDSAGTETKRRSLTRSIIADLSTAMEEGWHTTQSKPKNSAMYGIKHLKPDDPNATRFIDQATRVGLSGLYLTRNRVLHRGEFTYKDYELGQSNSYHKTAPHDGELDASKLFEYLQHTYSGLEWLDENPGQI